MRKLAILLLPLTAMLLLAQTVTMPGPFVPQHSGGGGATITYVSSESGSSTSSTNTCAVTITLVVGDLLFASVAQANPYDATDTFTVSDGSNTYNAITGSPWTDTGTLVGLNSWVSVIGTGGSKTITVTGSNSNPFIACSFAGYHSTTGWPASPVDVISSAQSNESITVPASGGGSVSVSAGTTGTTGNAAELIIGIWGSGSGWNPSVGAATTSSTGFTNRLIAGANSATVFNDDKFSSATGTFQDVEALTQTGGSAITAASFLGVTLAIKPN